MPIYEYRCSQCGRVSEFLIGVGQGNVEINCKYCGSKELSKMISAPSAVSGKIGSQHGKTCCGKEERCDRPPCSDDGACKR
jgi:putative FmdB family regulatory protein